MALPTDAITKYRLQYDRQLLEQAEILAQSFRQDKWETYQDATTYKGGQGHAPEASPNYPTSGVLTDNQRKLRVVGVLLGVSFTTNYATTRTAIQTAVGNL